MTYTTDDDTSIGIYTRAKAEWGTVQSEHGILALTQQAYVSDTGMHYLALAMDPFGNRYRVTWETTPEWDEAKEEYLSTGDVGILDDESNACDWTHPRRVIRI